MVAGVWVAAGLAVVTLLAAFFCQTPCLGPGSRRVKVIADLNTLQKIAVGFHGETGRWPESIAAMVNAKDSTGKNLMNSLDEFPQDPWGHEYHYSVVNEQVHLSSWGNDNAPGGEGEAADVIWQARGRDS